jgi:hypothetical protein
MFLPETLAIAAVPLLELPASQYAITNWLLERAAAEIEYVLAGLAIYSEPKVMALPRPGTSPMTAVPLSELP